MDFATVLQILDSTVRLATPLLLACLAGLFSERAGIFDIGLEGKMLASAFFAAAVAALTGSVWLGLLGLFLVGVLLFATAYAASIGKIGPLDFTLIAMGLLIIPALGAQRDEAAVPLLIETLTYPDEDWLGREMSAEALGRIGSPTAIPALTSAAWRGDTRDEAIVALAGIHDSRVVPVLISALDPGEEFALIS